MEMSEVLKQEVGNIFAYIKEIFAYIKEKVLQLLLCSIVMQNIKTFFVGPVVTCFFMISVVFLLFVDSCIRQQVCLLNSHFQVFASSQRKIRKLQDKVGDKKSKTWGDGEGELS